MQKRPIKYRMSDGTPVKHKCREESVCYFSVVKYINRGKTPDEAFQMAKETKEDRFKFVPRLRYKGELLKDYCKRTGIVYGTITSRMYNKGRTVEEAVELVRKLGKNLTRS